MNIQSLTVAQACDRLKSSERGLTTGEAERRGREFGPNLIDRALRDPLGWRLIKEFTHFFAVILWIAAGLAFFAEWRDPGQGMVVLGSAILGVILVNGAFSFWQEFRAERAVSALENLLPTRVQVWRDDKVLELDAGQLVPGDVVLLAEGDRVPADSRLIEAKSVRVDGSTLTGESVPVPRSAQPTNESDLLQCENIVLAGTSLVSGRASALVFATGRQSEFGKIARLTQSARKELSPLQVEIARVSRVIVVIAILLGCGFFLAGLARGMPLWSCLLFAIGIIVANVPEGLLPTVTLALAMGSQRMAARQALVRHLPAVETLGSTTVICTDKTGTLTQNQMEVRRIVLDGKTIDVKANNGDMRACGDGHLPFFHNAYLCHNLRRGGDSQHVTWQGDPMEAALVQLASRALPEIQVPQRTGELPFDAARKRLTIVFDTGQTRTLYCKGAPETVVPLCTFALLDGVTVSLTEDLRAQYFKAAEAMAVTGLRVIALAHRSMAADLLESDWERDMVLSGLIGLEDPPRPEVAPAIIKCLAAGVKVIIVTGDHPLTGVAIGREIGLLKSANPVVVTGDVLRGMSESQLQLALDAEEILFARVAAEQKMLIVEALKRKGEVVAVTGDGVNDAPALKSADIAIAMGASGTDVAREAADIVLLDDNFASIVAAIEEGRAVYANIRKFLTYILTSNVPELIPYLAFVLFRIPLPLTVIQILAVDLGTDMLPALALGAEPPGADVMRQKPRSAMQRLLNWPLMARGYLFLGVMEAVAGLASFFYVLRSGRWLWGEQLPTHSALYLRGTTACLAAIIVMQMVNVFLCRSERDSIFASRMRSNPKILVSVGVEFLLILAIVYTPWGNSLFGTAPFGLDVWFFVLPFAGAMLGLEEARKFWVRHHLAQ